MRENKENLAWQAVSRVTIFHQSNSTDHKSVVVLSAIQDYGFELVEYPSYSPEWTLSKYYLFPRGVMVKAMNCGIVVREFVLQSRYYVHFRANTLGKGMNPLILPPAMGK